MIIRRANEKDYRLFDEETLSRRLGYIVEMNHQVIPVTFTIFDVSKAYIDPVDSAYLEELIKAFQFHNGFVEAFYNRQGELLKKLTPVTLIKVNPNQLGVTQWLVSEKKLTQIHRWAKTPEDIIVPVFEYNQQLIALDGHTRLKFASMMEIPYIYVYKEPGKGLSKAFYRSSQKRDVLCIEDVSVVDSERYQRDWEVMCNAFIKTYHAKNKLRKSMFEKRQSFNAEYISTINQALVDRLLKFLSLYKIQKVGIFFPIGKEVDLRVLDVIYETYYPKIEGELVFVPNVGKFKEAPFKTRVPDTTCILKGDLDAIIVPGLCFDEEGSRLGYGKGYYDHYLSSFKGITIGVCFEPFFLDKIPKENHDQAVKFIVTDRRVIEVK